MRSRKLIVLAGALVLVLAGCSSGSKGNSPASPGSSGQLSNLPQASGTPLSVGFLSQSQGSAAYPDFGAGADPAVAYINGHGGVNGRPIKLVTCETDGSSSASLNCANKFVQGKVLGVVQGLDQGSDSALPILAGAGIPLLGHTAFGPKQSNSPDSYFFGAANDAYWAAPLVTLSKKYQAKSVATILGDNAFDRHYISTVTAVAAKSLGIDLSQNFYSENTPNFTSIFAAATSKKPDAVFFSGSEDECTGLASAAKTLAYQGKVFAGTCSAFIKKAPNAAEGVLTQGDLYLPDDVSQVPSRQAAELKIYLSAMKGGGVPEKYIDAFSEITFAGVMDFAAVLKTIKGDINSKAILTAIGGLKDAPGFMGQPTTCDGNQWPMQSSVCAAGLVTFQVKDGKRIPITGFVNPVSTVR